MTLEGSLSERSSSAKDGRAVAHLLRQLRENRSASQTDLAKLLGRSSSLVSRLESGERFPTQALLEEIVRALALSDAERYQLLFTAGYSVDEVERALDALLSAIGRQWSMEDTEQPLLRAELGMVIEGWVSYFAGVREIHRGLLNEARDRFLTMVTHGEYTPTLRLAVRTRLADIFLQRGKLAQATKLLSDRKSRVTRWRPGWAMGIRAQALATRGLTAMRRGLYVEAERLVRESHDFYAEMLTHAEERKNTVEQRIANLGLGKSHRRLAHVYLLQGQVDDAKSACQTAYEYLHRAGSSSSQERWLRRTVEIEGWAYSRSNDFEEAIKLHRRALDQNRRAEDRFGAANCYLYCGDDIRAELERRIQARLGARTVSDPKERRRIIVEALDSARALVDEAESMYGDALGHANSLGAQIVLGRAQLGLGVILRLQAALKGEVSTYIDSRRWLQEAEDVEQQIGQSRRLPGVYIALAELAWEQGDPGWAARASDYFRTARDKLNTLSADSPTGEESVDDASNDQRRDIDLSLLALERHVESDTLRENSVARWRPLLDSSAPEEWRRLCADLLEFVYRAIEVRRIQPIAHSPNASQWAWELLRVERMPEPRTLAQNTLSDSLTRHPTGENRALISRRHDVFVEQVKASSERRIIGPSRDLCHLATVKEQLGTGRMRERLQEADRLIHYYGGSNGYILIPGQYPLPLGFLTKGSQVLIEIPQKAVPVFIERQRVDGHQVAAAPGSILCFSINSQETADGLRDLFNQLVVLTYQGGASETAGQSQSWLADLIQPNDDVPLTGKI